MIINVLSGLTLPTSSASEVACQPSDKVQLLKHICSLISLYMCIILLPGKTYPIVFVCSSLTCLLRIVLGVHPFVHLPFHLFTQ